MPKSLKQKTSRSKAPVKIDAQRGYATPPLQFLFFLSNLSASYLSRYASLAKLRLTAIPIWLLLSDPLWSVVVISGIDIVAFLPTFRKSYHKPFEETAFTYVCSGLKSFISILALEHWSVITVLYPAVIVLNSVAFLTMVGVRRGRLGQG